MLFSMLMRVYRDALSYPLTRLGLKRLDFLAFVLVIIPVVAVLAAVAWVANTVFGVPKTFWHPKRGEQQER